MTKSKIYKNPFNYTGSKDRLLPQIIENLPKNTQDTIFIDLFGGSGTVGINLADKFDFIVYNEVNSYLVNIIKTFIKTPTDKILKRIDKIIEQFNLSKTNKEGFLQLREYYNKNKNKLDNASIYLYTLMCYSFNYFLTIDKSGRYINTSGSGRSWFNPVLRAKLIDYCNILHQLDLEHSFEVCNYDFRELGYCKDVLENNYNMDGVFFFVDPVYKSDDSYTRSYDIKWSEKDDSDLYMLLDKINTNGGQFMITNTTVCNGQENKQFIEFAKKYKIAYKQESFYGCSYQRKNDKTNEIIVINY